MPTRDEQKLLDNLNRAQNPGGGGPLIGGMVFLRLFLGFTFLRAGWSKLPYLAGTGPLKAQISEWAVDQTHPFWGYQEFLKAVVLPHLSIFQSALILSELVIGVLLLLGALTRLAAFGVLVVTVNYWFAGGYKSPAGAGQSEALAAIALVLIVAAAGRVLGADAVLARRFPHAPFW